jgi:hypothetical protein
MNTASVKQAIPYIKIIWVNLKFFVALNFSIYFILDVIFIPILGRIFKIQDNKLDKAKDVFFSWCLVISLLSLIALSLKSPMQEISMEVLSFFVFVFLIPYYILKLIFNIFRNYKRKQLNKKLLEEQAIKEEYERKIIEEQDKEQAEWEKQLNRKIQEEEALLKVRSNAMIEAFKQQMELMTFHKEQGANIDKEIIAMREKLLAMESQENEAMITNMLNTLNGL